MSPTRAQRQLVPEALVQWEPSEHPVVSCYVDWRVSGRGLHEQATVVRKALSEIDHTMLQRGAARDSFDADADRIQRFLEDEADPAARGFAIFASSGRGLWAVVELGVPVETSVHAGDYPALLPLIEASQHAGRSLIALLDTNTVRLIRLSRRGVEELSGTDVAPWTVKHSNLGGWSQARYQRGIDTEVERFATEAAREIATVMDQEGLDHLLLAGDEVITVPVQKALPQPAHDKVDAVRHVDIRADEHDVAAALAPELEAAAAQQRRAEIEELVERARGGHGAVSEPAEVRLQLEGGRVHTLALDPEVLEPEAAELVVREALRHRSRILVDRGGPLRSVEGLAATLR